MPTSPYLRSQLASIVAWFADGASRGAEHNGNSNGLVLTAGQEARVLEMLGQMEDGVDCLVRYVSVTCTSPGVYVPSHHELLDGGPVPGPWVGGPDTW